MDLIPMDESGFEEYRRYIAKHYARGKVEAGQWSEVGSLRKAEKELDALVPEGVNSAGHHFYSIRDGSNSIGMAWFYVREERGLSRAWIFDFVILEGFRGKGYGSRAMRAVEEKAKEHGAEEMGLHVFAHNEAAVRLYEKTGYAATSIVMSKSL